MSKSEKRNFKIYAKKQANSGALKFVRLFDLMDAQNEADDEALLQTVADGKPGKLANLKRHLYQKVLISLRLVLINKQEDIEIRQMVDFASILYGKGHVMDALRMLEKAKVAAVKHNFDFLHAEILEFQKLIEARHVTRSRQVKNKMDKLVTDSQTRAEQNLHTSFQSNINIQTQGYYILNGHARDEKQAEKFEEFWAVNRHRFERYPMSEATFFERINRMQSSMWRHYILLNLEDAKEDALNCYSLFCLNSLMMLRDPDSFVRSMYYVNALSFLVGDLENAVMHRNLLERFYDERHQYLNHNSKTNALVYQQLCRLNVDLARQDWASAKREMLKMKNDPIFHPTKLPGHRRNLIRYKFSAVHFALGDYTTAISQLQSILNSSGSLLRDDLLINTRLMLAIAYLEIDDFYMADYVVTNLSRSIRKNQYAGQLHDLTLSALRTMIKEERRNWPSILKDLNEAIQVLREDPFEQKCLRFFNVAYWIEHR